MKYCVMRQGGYPLLSRLTGGWEFGVTLFPIDTKNFSKNKKFYLVECKELYIFVPIMDKDTLYELRKAFLEEWITREELLDSAQRGIIEWNDYLWIIGAIGTPCKIIVE